MMQEQQLLLEQVVELQSQQQLVLAVEFEQLVWQLVRQLVRQQAQHRCRR
jgi:hypothetical protein